MCWELSLAQNSWTEGWEWREVKGLIAAGPDPEGSSVPCYGVCLGTGEPRQSSKARRYYWFCVLGRSLWQPQGEWTDAWSRTKVGVYGVRELVYRQGRRK